MSRTNNIITRLAFAIVLVFIISFSSVAQTTGKITGIVADSVEVSIGAVIVVVGDNFLGAFTDVDGTFTIENVPAGTYAISVTNYGFKPKEVEGIIVEVGKTTDVGTVEMESDAEVMAAIVVKGNRTTNSEMAAVTETKESKQVINVISAEQISKSQDRDAAQVMQRIPGVTLIQNRFVMVRGLSERYNTVLLNGAVAPSSEAETRAFSFDLVPSNMIDRISVYKSGSYDQPGDFAGAAIRIYTRNTVGTNTTQLSLTGGFRNGTTFKDFSRMEQYGVDALGFGAGRRSLPSDFPKLVNIESFNYDVAKLEDASNQLPSDWNINQKTALPDGRMNLLVARKLNVGSVKINTINNLSYSNTLQRSEIKRNQYWNYTATNESESRDTYTDQYYSNDVRAALLSNWSFLLNSKHKIDFRNMYSQLSSSDVVEREGVSTEKDTEYLFYSLRYASNRIYTGQLQGTHDLNKDRTKVSWLFGYSDINRSEPNWRRYSYQRQQGSSNPYELVVPSGASATDNARFYLELLEKGYTGNAEVEHKFSNEDDIESENAKEPISVKAGIFFDYRARDYSARWMSYSRGPLFDNSIAGGSIDNLQDNVNYYTGVTLLEGTRPSDLYKANGFLMAYYAGVNLPISEKVNVSTGARLEDNTQTLISLNGQTLVDTSVVRLLPSANISYNFSKKTLLRFAYYRTLNRPEFRELSPFSFYDFNFKVDKVGNPNLKTADIHNFDLRLEYYPSTEEMISFGVFYKNFINPIEVYQLPASSNLFYIYGNAGKAESMGIEVEVRKSLGFISAGSVLEKFSLLFNGSLIHSQLSLDKNISSLQISNRAMQGQSPYVVNTGVYYKDDKSGWQVSAMYNIFGKRIYAVGDLQIRSLYEKERHLVDLTINKDISEKFSVKIGASNILNAPIKIVEDGDYDQKINNSTVDKNVVEYRTGAYFTLGMNYKF